MMGMNDRCPANSKRTDKGAGYRSLAQSLLACRTTHVAPMNIPDVLFSDNVENLLSDNKAQYRHECATKIRMDRLKKITNESQPDHASPAKLRNKSKYSCDANDGVLKCLFCDKYKCEETLHMASTDAIEHTVRKWAKFMNDFELFARLSTGGDLFANETVYHKLCMSEYYN